MEDDEITTLIVPEVLGGVRLDRAMAVLLPDLSRARIQLLLEGGDALVDGVKQKSSLKLKGGETITVQIPEALDDEPTPENIPLDIVFEDEHLIVINKPVGMVVHPAMGHHTGTLVNALLYHCADSLSGINGVKRPGIVHRLDKDTSGLIIVAKTDYAHKHLAKQLATRTMSRQYMALVWGIPMPMKGTVDAPLARHPNNRLYMAVRPEGRHAITHYTVKQRFGETAALVECSLETGRTHQIRVHMQHNKTPIVGDPQYGLQPTAVNGFIKRAGINDENAENIRAFPRQALHAFALHFIHPETDEDMEFEIDLPDDFSHLLEQFEDISD